MMTEGRKGEGTCKKSAKRCHLFLPFSLSHSGTPFADFCAGPSPGMLIDRTKESSNESHADSSGCQQATLCLPAEMFADSSLLNLLVPEDAGHSLQPGLQGARDGTRSPE